MQQNDPKMIHTFSTYQNPLCLNRCLGTSNTKTKNYSKPPQHRHWRHLNAKADSKLFPKRCKNHLANRLGN